MVQVKVRGASHCSRLLLLLLLGLVPISLGSFLVVSHQDETWLRVANIESLKALIARPSVVVTSGYQFPDGKGAALYRWAPNDTTEADDCVVLEPLYGPSGRYVLADHSILDARTCGARLDGKSDDTAGLIRWLNAVLVHRIPAAVLPPGVALISEPLPTINKSGVVMRSAGSGGFHDTGTYTGDATTIRYIGRPGETMLTVAPDSSAAGQALTGNKILGITFDANRRAARGLLWQSVRWGDIDIAVHDAVVTGLEIGVVPELGEARDAQYSRIRFVGSQLRGAGASGLSLLLTGDAGANASFNSFEMVDIQHMDAPAIRSENADNNMWTIVRTHRAPHGSAPISVEWRGGPTRSQSTRAETFLKLSTNQPAIARGTLSGKVGASRIIVNLDYENGTPTPIVESGARVDGIWLTAFPEPRGGLGFSGKAIMRYLLKDRFVHFDMAITVSSAGSNTHEIVVPLPFVTSNNTPTTCLPSGRNLSTGVSLQGAIGQNSSLLRVSKYDGAYPAESGHVLAINGICEAPDR